jgi:hydrogenase maturation protein HypF
MARRIIIVKGVVQGVGFRPFVHELACRLGLKGFVRNEGGKVLIEAEGSDSSLNRFMTELSRGAPPLAHIDEITWLPQADEGTGQFSIDASRNGSVDSILISPDVATCDDCISELLDPADRRFAYPLLNCTNCGPRLTIITAAPYDRPRTTMADFPMCEDCSREYYNPSDRRFHAQPIACSVCGPRFAAADATGEELATPNPIAHIAAAILACSIVAVKGIGGYHLVCDARNEMAVKKLRERKHRDAKPFAVMVPHCDAARRFCEVSVPEKALLESAARPIVLLRRRDSDIADDVAPKNRYLGVMLPYAPVHHLLMLALGNIPLVMTSGNSSDAPIAYNDDDAMNRLHGLADFFLTHNRRIHVRSDDSVMRVIGALPLPVRRSRGYAPAPIILPISCHRPTLALGGHLKTTFALGRERQAILSHHLGDLEYYEAYRAYVDAISHYERLFAFAPEVIAHDLHPDYATSRYADERKTPIKRLAVQHHHAHMASCMAEHGLEEPVIGVVFDGAGLGTDKAVWGGEFLIGDYRAYRRAAHLRYVPLPGGEQAIREPWRMALAHLLDSGIAAGSFGDDVPTKAVDAVRRIIKRRFTSQNTSSTGRLFDAVAALARVRYRVEYEGQAAMELEWLATDVPPSGSYPFDISSSMDDHPQDTALEIDTRPLITAIAADVRSGLAAAIVARRFHSTLVEVVAQTCKRLRNESGIECVALSGGVFMNALLLNESVSQLTTDGFRVYRHEQVPPNDGGLCLGQLAIAAALQSCDNA